MLFLGETTPAVLIASAADVSIKAGMAAAGASALAWLLRRERAAVRYRVWLGALIVTTLAVLLVPFHATGGATQAAAIVLPDRVLPSSVSTMLAWVWVFGALAHTAGTLAGLAALASDARRLPVARERAWRRHVMKARRALGLRTSVRVLYGHADAVPVCWGLLGGTIVVPSAAMTWSRRLRRAVVLHECAHLRRRDPLAMLAEQVVCAALWFHPAVWVIVARLRRERELACDEAVVSAGVAPDLYARLLLTLARRCRPTREPAHAIVRASEMQDRIAALLAEPSFGGGHRQRVVLLAASGLFALLVITRVVIAPPPAVAASSAGYHPTTLPGESPASFRAGFFEADR
jgi:beta-lactamase regulating signal transducer with metallopeptidase domain